MKTKTIDLPKGGQLQVECTEKFLEAVRTTRNISLESEVTDYDIRMFIYDSFKIAVDKAENEIVLDEMQIEQSIE